MVWLLLTVMSSIGFASDCDSLFDRRHEGQNVAQTSYDCYKSILTQTSDLETQAHSYQRMTYLKFYIAEYYLDQKMPTLLEGIAVADKGLALFGEKYNVANYLKVPAGAKHELGWLLYNYGLSVSRYVDLAGKFEAIKRMEDIKKSMNSIMRMNEESVSFYGAHRTLGIFHMKVPAIAGGRIELSEQYLKKAVASTSYSGILSRFPQNNLSLAELFLKLDKKDLACEQISIVAALKDSDVATLDNGHPLETTLTLKKAREMMITKKCP